MEVHWHSNDYADCTHSGRVRKPQLVSFGVGNFEEVSGILRNDGDPSVRTPPACLKN
jgi:hypothetical protein